MILDDQQDGDVIQEDGDGEHQHDAEHDHDMQLVGEELGDVDMNGFVFMDSDSDEECDHVQSLEVSARQRVAHERPEFVELQALNLTNRPAGCTIGVHEGNQVWRTSCSGSTHYGRVWGAGTGRSPKQALIRVLILMLTQYCEANNSDRLAKKQLKRLEELWSSDPGKP